jgi:hypothetical protein
MLRGIHGLSGPRTVDGVLCPESASERIESLCLVAWCGKTPVTSSPLRRYAAALIYAEVKLFKFGKTNLDATAGLLPALYRIQAVSVSIRMRALLHQDHLQFEMEQSRSMATGRTGRLQVSPGASMERVQDSLGPLV